MRFSAIILVLLFYIGTLTIFINVSPTTASSTRLYINPDQVHKTYLDCGSNFTVSVKIENVTDLYGFDLKVTWDSTLITFNDCSYDESLDAMWGSGKWIIQNSVNGSNWCKLRAKSTESGFSTADNQTLFTLEFRVGNPFCNSEKEMPISFSPPSQLTDSNNQPINHTAEDGTYTITGKTPTLQTSPSNLTCCRYCQNFTITINVSEALNIEALAFEIHYNTTLLDFANITWDAWGSGTITTDEARGNITGSTSGNPRDGNLTLVTIAFNASYYHIWRDLQNWENDLTGTIYFQWANFSYPEAPGLRYQRGVQYEINVSPDVIYKFSPIKGDMDLNGDVDIFDLNTVAAFYDKVNDTYNLTGDPVVDIFDIVVIAANFGYSHR